MTVVGSLESSVLCEKLIGRTAYLEQLQRVLDAAASGRGSVIAISGEAGIGKSRLVAEAGRLSQAHDPAFNSAHGNCFEFDTMTPFAPLVDLLRGCLNAHSPEEIESCTADDAPALIRIVPELGAHRPDVEPAPSIDPEHDKRRIFTALTNVLGRFARKAPLLIAIEDLHWSDENSIEFLAQFGRHIASSPIVLLLTFRADELSPSATRLLAALDRERIVVDWALEHLSLDEVGDMVNTIFQFGQSPSRETTERLRTLTEGNPFFIEEVLKSLVVGGDISSASSLEVAAASEVGIPRSVQASVDQRIGGLSAPARQVVEMAAVTGRRFDFKLLERLSELSEDELLSIIKELIAAQLVAEESADHYVFRHALTQQAIYSSLLARERRSMHGRIGEALQSVYADAIDAHVPELAHHFWSAEAWDEAYFYCRRAGEGALGMHAPSASLEQLTRALGAAEKLGVTPPPQLYRLRGQCREMLGQFGGARSDYERAFERAQASQDGRAEWQALIDLGFLWAGRDYQRCGDYFRHAVDLAELLDDDVLRAKSWNRLGNWLANVGQGEEGIGFHERALAIAEGMHDELAIVDTLDLLAMANGLYGNQPESLRRYREAITLIRRLGDKERLAAVLAGVAAYFSCQLEEATHVEASNPQEELAIGQEAVALSAEIASLPAEMFARMSFAQLHYDQGRYTEALALAQDVARLSEETGHQQWRTSALWELGVIGYYTFDFSTAAEQLRQATDLARQLGSAWWLGNAATFLGRCLMALGDLDGADNVLQAAWSRDTQPTALGPRWVWLAFVELDLARREPQAALDRIDWLLANAPGVHAASRMPGLRRTRGEALMALSRLDEAREQLLQARKMPRRCTGQRFSGPSSVRWEGSMRLRAKQISQSRTSRPPGKRSTPSPSRTATRSFGSASVPARWRRFRHPERGRRTRRQRPSLAASLPGNERSPLSSPGGSPTVRSPKRSSWASGR